MDRPIIAIHDADGNETIRPMNDDEYAQFLIDYEAAKAKEAAELAAAEAKTAAQAKLAALGLTTDDLKALGLGSN
jgi:hypothetical protein